MYVKTATLHARRITEAGVVETMINGEVETRKEATPGDYEVLGTEGERYVLSAANFLSRYLHESPTPQSYQPGLPAGNQ